MIESITFDTEQSKLIIMFDDGEIVEYTKENKDKYIADYPDRYADVVAMGWNV